ncbi:MAG: ribonuclease T2 family protein [Methylovirgula sp.]
MVIVSRLLRAALVAGVCGLCPLGSAAQYSGCILDNCADKKPLPPPSADQNSGNQASPSPGTSGSWTPYSGPQPSGASAPGDFDFYVFSLSWSPGFCDTGGAEKARDQCRAGAGLGFVVHGLWPQYNQGFPSDCGGGSPSWIVLQSIEGLYPDTGLARYEWRKHGTCSGKSPAAYFADVRRARDLIVVPPTFQNAQSEQDTGVLDIERAFFAANSRLRPGMMAVECVGRELSEVRFCLSKDVRNFVPCPEVARHSCYAHEIAVAPMR